MWKNYGCDIGIATDGDADRLGVIDDKAGSCIPIRFWCCCITIDAVPRLARRSGAELATTHLLDRIAEDFGETCYEVPVGFKYVSAKMVETGAIIGGESPAG